MKKKLTLKDYEAHIASMCVAIISGGIGGTIISKGVQFLINLFIAGNPGDIGELILAGGWGWWLSWLVCKHLFPSAHEWYGHGSWSHRIYDLVGIVSGVGIYWLVR